MPNLAEILQREEREGKEITLQSVYSVCALASGLRLYQKHMALARPTIPAAGMGYFRALKHRRLAISAIVLSALCSLAAFISLVWRDQSQPRVMINEQSSPALARGKGVSAAPPSAAAASSKTAPAKLSEPINRAMKPFSISKASGLAPLGAVQLRLINTYPATNVYDLNVIVGGRSFLHRHLRVNQPLWIAGKRGGGAIELIVKLVQDDAITGYWMESNRLAQVSSRRRLARQ